MVFWYFLHNPLLKPERVEKTGNRTERFRSFKGFAENDRYSKIQGCLRGHLAGPWLSFLGQPPPKKKRRGHGWCWWSGTSHPIWFQVICKTEKSDSDGDLSRMLYINCNMASNRQITQNHPGLVWVIEMFIFLAFWRWWGCEPPRKKTYRFSARRIGIRWPLKKQNRGPRACPNRA